MRAVITERDVPYSGDLKVERGALITPSARDLARERGVRIIEVAAEDLAAAPPAKTVAIGADHGGFSLKEQVLKPLLAELGLHVRDVGVADGTTADYPDIALRVASLVHDGQAGRGIIVDGAGIGSAMAANKVPGVRAALCYDRASARNSREHNDANVLTLGGRLLTPSQAEEVVRVWLSTPFGGGRHQVRIDKITAIEKAYLK
ncbi:MAG: ribose 5-phosphate isomerase B [Acidobacteria bacterium]|nr:ribose 5-phosphate isomerase B [Acidobacteriota bacterium]